MVDIGSGLAGVLGAVVGGLGTFLATWLNLKKHQHQADKQRYYILQDRRHEAHRNMLERLYKFDESARELNQELEDKDQLSRSVEKAYLESWSDLHPTLAAALIAGPKELSAKLNTTFDAVADYSNAVDQRIDSRRKAARHDERQETFRASIFEYAEAARTALSLDE
ncbi:hypothetical protein DW322_13225 [Rhodococcus rhodnii]|uniref:Uncharacterized protein n=2 Tax=Rhodococcus rhodnii TaxID=38312 RepID=R7WKL1_9NOCA|nr:hypothetical protein [Rhodococcus rhodnii]EOM75833.1 hypothetical protein Rrhod_2739 [Rhodococcus rhodnii LMG 5362]TXG91011.1 hypothetical protein DW322_13225 [Rhodococcus rhodnii]